MSNHVFDIFNSSSRNSTKVTSKINGGKSHFSNNFQPVKPLEPSHIRIKSSSGLNIRQPLADRQSVNQLKAQTTTLKKSPLKPKAIEEIDHHYYKKCEDTYEDILPKHKRINVDDIKNILSCFSTPTPRASAIKQVSFPPPIIPIEENFNKENDYMTLFEDDFLELSPPKNPFYDDDNWDMF